MLGYFPAPYPDEMLFNTLVRYARTMPAVSNTQILIDLFGRSNITINLDFPVLLQELHARLPPGMKGSITVDQLIDNHTLFGLVSPFKSQQEIDNLREAMRAGTLRSAYSSRLNQDSSRSTYLRLCTGCLRADIAAGRELYWRRTHQIACVRVCLEHSLWLADSSIKRSALAYNEFNLMKPELPNDMPERQINPLNLEEQALLCLAQYVRWLLNNPTRRPAE